MCKTCLLSKLIYALNIGILVGLVAGVVVYLSGYADTALTISQVLSTMVIMDLILRVRRLEKMS